VSRSACAEPWGFSTFQSGPWQGYQQTATQGGTAVAGACPDQGATNVDHSRFPCLALVVSHPGEVAQRVVPPPPQNAQLRAAHSLRKM
jgi:hypothetical protein